MGDGKREELACPSGHRPPQRPGLQAPDWTWLDGGSCVCCLSLWFPQLGVSLLYETQPLAAVLQVTGIASVLSVHKRQREKKVITLVFLWCLII